MRWSIAFLVGSVACAIGCGDDGGASPGPDAAAGGDAGLDATGGSDARADAASDDAGSCPAQQPTDGASCGASMACSYGHSTCCGVDYPEFTCKCQGTTFSCALTVECNIICADAGARDASDSG